MTLRYETELLQDKQKYMSRQHIGPGGEYGCWYVKNE